MMMMINKGEEEEERGKIGWKRMRKVRGRREEDRER